MLTFTTNDDDKPEVKEYVYEPNDVAFQVVEYILVTEQMSWKNRLSPFKEKGEYAITKEEKGEDAITKELKQVYDMDGFEPKHCYELSAEQRKKTLRYLMYLKEKRCEKTRQGDVPMDGNNGSTRTKRYQLAHHYVSCSHDD